MRVHRSAAGVVFAVLLSNQQAAVFLGLVDRNVMLVDHAGADLWILPASTETLQPGRMVSDASLMQARVVDGVARAEPILFGGATVALPSGGSEPVQLIFVPRHLQGYFTTPCRERGASSRGRSARARDAPARSRRARAHCGSERRYSR
jgi:hypothetical protein